MAKQRTIENVTPNTIVKVGQWAIVGNKYDYRETEEGESIGREYSILRPQAMRLIDRNKYPRPHKGGGQAHIYNPH